MNIQVFNGESNLLRSETEECVRHQHLLQRLRAISFALHGMIMCGYILGRPIRVRTGEIRFSPCLFSRAAFVREFIKVCAECDLARSLPLLDIEILGESNIP